MQQSSQICVPLHGAASIAGAGRTCADVLRHLVEQLEGVIDAVLVDVRAALEVRVDHCGHMTPWGTAGLSGSLQTTSPCQAAVRVDSNTDRPRNIHE